VIVEAVPRACRSATHHQQKARLSRIFSQNFSSPAIFKKKNPGLSRRRGNPEKITKANHEFGQTQTIGINMKEAASCSAQYT